MTARTASTREPSRIFSPFGVFCSLAALVLLRNEVTTLPQWWASFVIGVVFFHCLAQLYRWDRGQRITLGFMFAAMYGLFHFGLFLSIVFGVDFSKMRIADIGWAYGDGFTMAGVYAAIGLYAFTSGYSSTRTLRFKGALAPSRRSDELRTRLFKRNGSAGGILVLVGIVLWVWNLILGGVQFGDNYISYLEKTAALPMPVALLLIGLGVSLLGAGTDGAIGRAGLACVVVWAPFAALLGLRGEVLIPAVSFFIARSRRRHVPFGVRRIGILALLALSVGSVVRVVRVGATDASQLLAAMNPAASLVELGYSIRPMMLALHWRINDAESFVGVATYLSPLRRFVIGRILGGEVLPVAMDPAVFGGVMSSRIGPVGGSIAAEAYRVGGVAAIVIVLALIGFLVALADTVGVGDPVVDASVAMLAFILLLWIRNDFTPVPFEMIFAGLIVLGMRAFPAPSSSSSRSSRGRAVAKRATSRRVPVTRNHNYFDAQSTW